MYSEEQKEQGSISVILAAMFALFFLLAGGFGVWAFMGREDYKNNVDEKVAVAVDVAVQNTETAKDAEFLESEKLPTRRYAGSSTFGSLSFEYPKTWSVYSEDKETGTVVNVYAHPGTVPGLQSDQPYALRVEILDTAYSKVAESLERDIESATITAKSYRPKNVDNILGLRIDGQIEREVTGAAVYMPLRDRTIKIYTESPEFLKDFNGIVLPSITFVP